MADWYVRPDTSHNVTRDGTEYQFAWGGWDEIIWGASGVNAGDTLYVCGSHAYSASKSIGTHNGTSGSVATITGLYEPDRGSITFTGSSFLSFGRSYTTLDNLTINAGTSNCAFIFGALEGLTIKDCSLNGGTSSPVLNFSGGNGSSYTDLIIDGNTFTGGGGGNGSAISWLIAALNTPLNTMTRVSILNNTFTGCSSDRAVIHLRIEDSANTSSIMSDIIVSGNTFIDCVAVAMEIYGPGVYGRNKGIRVIDNVIRNQQPITTFGGGISIGGFAPSTTEGWGHNIIARNYGYILRGPTGLVNVFYGTYRVFDNYGEDLSTQTIDGNGLLFDHGCDGCIAYGNKFKRLTGNPGVSNSGCGIMVLDATNVICYGNIVDGCLTGIFIGNKDAGQSSDLYNNTILNCSVKVINILSTANLTDNIVRNSILSATANTVPAVVVASGTWTGESNNNYHNCGAATGHTLTDSLELDPVVDPNYRPITPELIGSAAYIGGRDFTGKPFYDPPNYGAVDVRPAKPRCIIKG